MGGTEMLAAIIGGYLAFGIILTLAIILVVGRFPGTARYSEPSAYALVGLGWPIIFPYLLWENWVEHRKYQKEYNRHV